MKYARKHFFHLHRSLPALSVFHFFLLLKLLMLSLMQVAIADFSSSEILQLQGPRNVTIERGSTAHLRCRLLIAKSTDASRFSPSNLRFISWKARTNQRLNVQWIVDGFGFTNKSLIESFEGRYLMPGPLNEGHYSISGVLITNPSNLNKF